MIGKNNGFKIISILLSTLFSNCTCSCAKRYQVNKINRINKKKIGHLIKRRFDIKKFRKNKSNLVPNALKIAGVLVSATGLGFLVKEYFGKHKKHNDKTERLQMEVKLSKVDEEYIRRNFFLCAWENNSCWNDVVVQLLMCPDIMRGVWPKSIMIPIKFINTILKQKYNGHCLCRKVKFPINKRPLFDFYYLDADNLNNKEEHHTAEYHLKNSKFAACPIFHLFFDGQRSSDLGLFGTTKSLDDEFDIPEDFSKNTIRREDWFKDWEIDLSKTKERLGYSIRFKKIEKWNSSNIFFENVGYYPTFVRILRSKHFVSYYIIYNENKEVKYFLLADGMKKNMVVSSKEQALEQIGRSKNVDIVYTRSDIVEQYYVPR